ncbi:MAG: SBBP repeat-containing protein [Candidatus Coatesbacteria bacterium]
MSLRRPRPSALALACLLALVCAPVVPGTARAAADAWWETSPTETPTTANAVAVDPDGNVYVGGTTRPTGASGAAAAFLRRYSRYGGQTWNLTGAGSLTASYYEQAVRGVAVLPTSATTWDIVVAGVISSATSYQDIWVSRLTMNGVTVWSTLLDPTTGGSDGANAVAVTPGGDVVAAGWAGSQIRLEVLRGSDGAPIYSASYFDALSGNEAALAVAVDAAGSVYVGGYRTLAAGDKNAWVAQYPADVSLGLVWEATLSAAWTATAYVGGLAVNASAGALYAVGAVSSAATQRDVLTARLNLAGAVAWTATIDGGAGLRDEADACALASDGDLLIAGGLTSLSSSPFADLWVARAAPDGSLRWQFTRDGPGHQVDGGLGIAGSAQGEVLVAGYEADTGAAALPRLYLADLRETSTAVVPSGGSPVPHPTPNPFRPGQGGAYDASAITFRSLTPGSAVRIYTLAGELVAELKDDDRDGLVVWSAKNASGKDAVSGVYIFVVAPEHGATTRGKLVIIR